MAGNGFCVVSDHECPDHHGSLHTISGCPLHRYFPRDHEIVSFSERPKPVAPSTHYIEVSSSEASESPTNSAGYHTPASTPTRSTPPLVTTTGAFNWVEAFAASEARRRRLEQELSHSSDGSNASDASSEEAPPEPITRPKSPLPTESECDDWLNKESSNKCSSPTFDELNINIDIAGQAKPQEYADFDPEHPPLCLPDWYTPSEKFSSTEWYSAADAREAEAWAACHLDDALKHRDETTAVLVAAEAAAERACEYVHRIFSLINKAEHFGGSLEGSSSLSAALDNAMEQARAANEAVKTASVVAARARADAREAAEPLGIKIEDEPEEDDDSESTLPAWARDYSWMVVDKLNCLGETKEEYDEHS